MSLAGSRGAAFAASPHVPSRAAAAARPAWPVMLVVLLLFGVSGGMLWLVGYNYDGLSGGVITKIHPSTYLVLVLVAVYAILSGNPVGYAIDAAWRRPGGFILVLATIVMFLFIVARALPGMAGALDTFLPAPLLLLLLADIDERGLRRLELVMHALMTLNALLALFEFATQTHVFPYRFDGEVFPFDTRSTALQGHPLVNAAVTGWYVLALLTGSPALPRAVRLLLVPLQLAALVTFGGRAATVVTFGLAALHLLQSLHNAFRRGRIPILAAAVALFLLSLIPVAIAFLAEGGFFDLLLRRFVSDGGSANARVEMFDMFAPLSFRDLLIGPDPALIESLRRTNGLEWGIEQPIVKTLLYDGIFITVMMLAALTVFLREVARACAPGVWLPMLCFVVLLQTSESISTKTTILTKFVVMMVCLYPPRRVRLPAISVRARR